MKKAALIAIFISATLMLQGCTTVAVVSAVGAGVTSVATDSRTTGTQIDDTTLYSRVNVKLRYNRKYFNDARVVFSAYNGNVLLIGQAKSEQILKAESLVKQVDGVTRVVNQMTNGEPISVLTITHDLWITTQVKSYLFASLGFEALQIKVITEDSNIFLQGVVSSSLGKAAAETSSKVYGVSHVTTIFSYKNGD